MDALKLFEEAFSKGSLWNELHYDNRPIKICSRYVAWFDVMGSKHVMVNAIRNAICFVGVLHQAVVLAKRGFKSVEIHSMTDGVYAVSDSFNDITMFATCIMRSCARHFLQQSQHCNRFLVRGAISYGKVALPTYMAKGLQPIDQTMDEYSYNVMLGIPFVKAEQGEHNAPPFGIYLDESIRTQTDDALKIAWVLHRWWNHEKNNESCFAKAFGGEVLKYLGEMEENPISYGAPGIDKLRKYESAVREYFELADNDSEKGGSK